jgi:hypothetical protein
MSKKFFSMSVAILAVAAFAVVPAIASAHEYGNCNKTGATGVHPPCTASGKVFTPLTGGATGTAIITKGDPGDFFLKNETTPANKIKCEKESGQGVEINSGGTGTGAEVATFEKCKGEGALAFCETPVSGTAQKINGTEKIIGAVEFFASGPGETTVNIVPGSFEVACTGGVPESTVNLGTVTGSITGKAVALKPYELFFNEAGGLKFAGEGSDQTGTQENEEAFKPGGKIYEN